MPTGKKPASEAGKELASKKTSAKAEEVAGSTLSQANKNHTERTGTKAASDTRQQLATGTKDRGRLGPRTSEEEVSVYYRRTTTVEYGVKALRE